MSVGRKLDSLPAEKEKLVGENKKSTDNGSDCIGCNVPSNISRKNTNQTSDFKSNINISEMKSFILEIFDVINKDSFYMEPMLIPIVPNTD